MSQWLALKYGSHYRCYLVIISQLDIGADTIGVDTLIALSIPSLILLYLSLTPYTKIEESFTIQATHDILTFGIHFRDRGHYPAATYDHVKYPELHPVPRSFVAPLLLAVTSSPFARFVRGIDTQILGRQTHSASLEPF